MTQEKPSSKIEVLHGALKSFWHLILPEKIKDEYIIVKRMDIDLFYEKKKRRRDVVLVIPVAVISEILLIFFVFSMLNHFKPLGMEDFPIYSFIAWFIGFVMLSLVIGLIKIYSNIRRKILTNKYLFEEKLKIGSIYSKITNLMEGCVNGAGSPIWDSLRPKISDTLEKAIDSLKYPLPKNVRDEACIKQFKCCDNESNICGIWASKPSLMEDSAAIYYLFVNGLVCLAEYLDIDNSSRSSKKIRGLKEQREMEGFAEEEREILTKIANDENINHFYSLRFLIFSKADYEKSDVLINILIEFHQSFRQHCIPLVKEKLDEKIKENEDFRKCVMDLAITEEDKEGLYVPDLLLIQNFKDYKCSANNHRNSFLWLIRKGKIESEPDKLEKSKKLMKHLASSCDNNTVWEQYNIPVPCKML